MKDTCHYVYLPFSVAERARVLESEIRNPTFTRRAAGALSPNDLTAV